MASFTAVGDSVSLQMTHKGDIAAVAISGTYSMVIALQREEGSPGSGAWETLKSWSTANATVAYQWVTEADNESLRLIVTTDTSGTATATLTDTNDELLDVVYDSLRNIRRKMYQDGDIYYNQDGDVVLDTRLSQRFVDVSDANYTVLAANTGKVHLVANVSADRTFTLPANKDGLEFTFVATLGAADGHDWIFAAPDGLFIGAVTHLDTNAGTGGAEVVSVAPDASDDDALQVNTPAGGTEVTFRSNGTNWVVSGVAVSVTAPVAS